MENSVLFGYLGKECQKSCEQQQQHDRASSAEENQAAGEAARLSTRENKILELRMQLDRGIENEKVDQFCHPFCVEVKKVIHMDKKAGPQTGSWDAPE